MTVHIALEDPMQPEIVTLLRAGEDSSAQLYPAESNHHLALDALRTGGIGSSASSCGRSARNAGRMLKGAFVWKGSCRL